MDDEESFGYKRFAEFAKSTFTADLNGKTATFVNSVSVGAGWAQDVEEMYYNRMIERIVIMGAETAPKAVTIDGEKLDFSFSEDSKVIVIRKPDQSAMGNFTIALNMSE
jgi:hypothetical protein